MMKNLKLETIAILKENGKTVDDVAWVGTTAFKIPTDSFWKLADRNYDDSYGSPEVATDLLVVGNGWWLERHEYDGAEWWEFKSFPVEPSETRTVDRVITPRIGWETLEEVNVGKEEGWVF